MPRTEKTDEPRRYRGPGRRPKPPTELRQNWILRLSPIERSELYARATLAGLTPAVYARLVLLGRPLPPMVPPVNRTAWRELARLANNLNQWVHAINAQMAPAGERPNLDPLRFEVQQLRRALLGDAASPATQR